MDSDAQSRAKLENNLTVFNYGVHFTYRWLKYENTATAANAGASNPFNQNANASAALTRYSTNGALYLPDLWLKYERRKFRFELEGAAALGNMGMPTSNDPDSTSVQNILIVQFGATAQAEVRLLDGALKIGLEGGYASGDKAPGMGQRPNRRSLIAGSEKSNVGTTTGNIDGPQYACSSAKVCADNAIRNFRFARDYRVDMILWREIIGGLTDALYAKPTIAYTITEGLSVSLGVIYSRAVYAASTPSGKDANLGVEFNVGAKYETDDGFYGALNYGLLVPLPGLENSLTGLNLDVAQAVRANVGIRF